MVGGAAVVAASTNMRASKACSVETASSATAMFSTWAATSRPIGGPAGERSLNGPRGAGDKLSASAVTPTVGVNTSPSTEEPPITEEASSWEPRASTASTTACTHAPVLEASCSWSTPRSKDAGRGVKAAGPSGTPREEAPDPRGTTWPPAAGRGPSRSCTEARGVLCAAASAVGEQERRLPVCRRPPSASGGGAGGSTSRDVEPA